ncbi:NEW3 domain-containing protein [uncultured Thermanaerothrix sp.]|uniref:COG1470 family protein n=1 Tax=uncultured Thermanaerothrix sp. TaxID=1195149 RepID=UPI002639F607|nr:NEW3 domain-containing protein [uncultured Thermanaerothrix sp.]
MKRLGSILFLAFVSVLITTLALVIPANAQDITPESNSPNLTLYTTYPSLVVGPGETVSVDVHVRVASQAEVVRLQISEVPEGWTATLRGGGKTVQAVYVQADSEANLELRLDQPKTIQAGTYRVVVTARTPNASAQLPIEITIKEKQPSRLSFDVDLPVLRGSPSTTFRYSVTLKNEGDDEITVNLSANAPRGFQVNFRYGGQDVTSLPLGAKESKSITVEAQPLVDITAGSYPITIIAQGNDTQASLDLTAEVTGQPSLSITTPDGRLSGQVYTGRETSLKLIVQNTGSAPAKGVKLSASAPSGWTATFDPEVVDEIATNAQSEVTLKIKPADNAIAGDYMLTLRATPTQGASKSVDFRITVLTSTLWGITGVVLIAIAVGVVMLAVIRFGRR